jgi:hypothetical protein
VPFDAWQDVYVLDVTVNATGVTSGNLTFVVNDPDATSL